MKETKMALSNLIVQRVKKSQIAIGMNFRKNCNLHEAGMLWYHCLHPMKYHVIIKIYHWLAIQSKTKIDKVEFSFLFRFFTFLLWNTLSESIFTTKFFLRFNFKREKNSDDANDNILTKHVVLFSGGNYFFNKVLEITANEKGEWNTLNFFLADSKDIK